MPNVRHTRTAATTSAAAASLPNFVIRPTLLSDAPHLENIEVLCGPHGSAGWSRGQLEAELSVSVSRSLTAESAGHVVGFIVGWLIADELQILELATHPNWQRRGIASKLLWQIIEDCRGSLRTVTLEVKASNASAIALYERFGFQAVGRRPRYYQDGTDAVLLTRLTGVDVTTDMPPC